MSKDFVFVIKLHGKHGVRQRFNDNTLYFYCIFF